MSFSYKLELLENIVIIYFKGRIFDKSEADELYGELDTLISVGKNKMIVDFSNIDYINSSGLNVLINLLNKSRDSYGELIICNIPEKVLKLIVTSKLENIFKIEDSKESALQKIQS